MDILPPPPTQNPFESKIKVTPTMAIILVCLMSSFLVMCCVSIYARHLVERRLAAAAAFTTLESHGIGSGRRSRRRTAAAHGLDPSVIDSFPTFLYSEVKAIKTGAASLECAVCLNEFEDLETLRFLPRCCHVFHSDCIDAWLSSHVTCPVCRSNLMIAIPEPGETILYPDPGLVPSDPVPNHDAGPDPVTQIESPEIVSAVERKNRSCERFTLRLPEEVRSRLVTAGLSRTKSCVAFPTASSERKGYRMRSGSTGYERFGREDRLWFVATPPVFSRAASGRGEEVTATPRSLLTAVTAPLNKLTRRSESEKRAKRDSEFGERSFDRLRLDC